MADLIRGIPEPEELDGTAPDEQAMRGLLCKIAESACELLGCAATGIWLADDGGQLSLDLMVPPPEAGLVHRATHDGLIGRAASQRERVVVTGADWEAADLSLTEAGFRSGMALPLVWQGDLLGVVAMFDTAADRALSGQEGRIAELLAEQAAAVLASQRIAVQNVRLNQSLELEHERLLHVQVAIRQMLEQPDLQANLVEVVEALQALGWRRVALALFAEDESVAQLLTAGIPEAEQQAYREAVVAVEVWQRFVAGELTQFRVGGLFFIPYGDQVRTTWHPRDLVFAPLQMGQERVAGVIRVENPVDDLRPTQEMLRPLDILASQAAYVVENARLLAASSESADVLAEQVEELSMMHRADRELSSHLNVDRIMKLTMDWALRRTGADTGLLMLMSDDKRGLVPFVTMGYLDREKFAFNEQHPMPVDYGIMGRAARTGQTQWVQDVSADQDFVPFLPNARVHLSVPLSMRGEVLGVVTLASSRDEAFGEHDVSFLERLARRAAVALDNARLYRQAEQLADDMAVLYTASRTITSTLERDEILQRIAQSMAVALECSSAIIFDYHAEAETLQVLTVYRLGTAHFADEVLPPVKHTILLADYPAFQTVAEQHHPLVLRASDLAISSVDRAYLAENKIHAMLVVPLEAQGELIGLAVVNEGRHDRIFSANEVYKAETLASQAAVGLRQSLLYNEVLELEKLKSEMIRMASHDLRNPLNNIMGYIELLAMSMSQLGMTPDQEQYIDNLRRGSQAMRSLLEDLLTLERIESDRQNDWQRFDMGGLVSEVVEAQRPSAGLKHQSLTLDRMPDVPPAYGSLTQLRQAVANLVGNAIKYTPEEGQIFVQVDVQDRRLQVWVKDSGYGISPERQPRIFERFYRAHEPGTDHIGGTGLGLSLVKTVVERHGGQVWFESELGKGSTFGFWLPIVES